MSFSVFVGLCLIGTWALLPISLIIAMTSFDDEALSEPHDH
ncbi:hypothetical protein OAT67_05325 [Bacteriovoracaceae bacterium]|nr:hypothetical protein [Bacteriovoracaceae bacterium]